MRAAQGGLARLLSSLLGRERVLLGEGFVRRECREIHGRRVAGRMVDGCAGMLATGGRPSALDGVRRTGRQSLMSTRPGWAQALVVRNSVCLFFAPWPSWLKLVHSVRAAVAFAVRRNCATRRPCDPCIGQHCAHPLQGVSHVRVRTCAGRSEAVRGWREGGGCSSGIGAAWRSADVQLSAMHRFLSPIRPIEGARTRGQDGRQLFVGLPLVRSSQHVRSPSQIWCRRSMECFLRRPVWE